MNYAQLNKFDTENGPGVRVSLFVSGCTLNCPGCFNQEAHNFKHGKLFDAAALEALLGALGRPEVSGLSILGGDPCEPKNVRAVTRLCRYVKWISKITGGNKTIWLWTGRTIEELHARQDCTALLRLVDVIVDGPFLQDLADSTLEHRGSANQRVLHRERGDF